MLFLCALFLFVGLLVCFILLFVVCSAFLFDCCSLLACRLFITYCYVLCLRLFLELLFVQLVGSVILLDDVILLDEVLKHM